MKKFVFLIIAFLFICALPLMAQTRTITGTVTSATEGEGVLPGVTVTIKGTSTGTLTDLNGKFSIPAPQNAATLVFSYIGMKKQERQIGNQDVINVIMEPDILGLDEVVVTALGISREKKSLGY